MFSCSTEPACHTVCYTSAGAYFDSTAATTKANAGSDTYFQARAGHRSEPTDVSVPAESLVMLEDPLDEPKFYCVDVAGFGANLNVNSPLQAHTCKPGADDEMFAFNTPSQGKLYLAGHDRCLEADGGSVYVRSCSESPLQRFAYDEDMTIRVEGESVCLTVAGEDGQPAGGQSHLRRDLLLDSCAEVEPSLSRLVFPGPSPNP